MGLADTGIRESTEPGFLQITSLERLSVLHAFSTRKGGVSISPYHSLNLGLIVGDDPAAVQENRLRFFGTLGLDLSNVVRVRQVHGNDVLVVGQELAGNERFPRLLLDDGYSYDAMVTDIPGLSLTISTADCLPIFVVDPRRRAVGAVHAGWRSTVKRVVDHALGAMREVYGTDPAGCYAAIGPGIRGCCYEVDEPVISSVKGACRGWQDSAESPGEGRWMLDLGHLNVAILREVGLGQDRILDTGLCTACRTDIFYSYRAEKPRTGRMMSLIALM
ncbi:MAG: peptidoglycan editing factor PgeF [Candidatus Methylomirabilales bacterium]